MTRNLVLFSEGGSSTRLETATMRIRLFAPQDAAGVVSVESRAFASRHWTENDYHCLAQQGSGIILVAEDWDGAPGKIIGFIALRQILDAAEILNLAVDPDCQRRGVARALVQAASSKLRENNVRTIYLEVRPSNRAALGLYSSVGFIRASVRRSYYSHPQEDAYVLQLTIRPA